MHQTLVTFPPAETTWMLVPATLEEEIQWTPYGYKHWPSTVVPWREIIVSTLGGPAKYRPGIAVEMLEIEAYKIGTPTTNGKPWKVMEYPHCIGASQGSSVVGFAWS